MPLSLWWYGNDTTHTDVVVSLDVNLAPPLTVFTACRYPNLGLAVPELYSDEVISNTECLIMYGTACQS